MDSTLARTGRVVWTVCTIFVVESLVFGLSGLPAFLFWTWALSWATPPCTWPSTIIGLITTPLSCAVIAPIVPAFYNKPKTVDDIVNHTVGRLLDLFEIETRTVKRWKGGPEED